MAKEEEKRNAYFMFLIGHNRTGKSSLAQQIVWQYKEDNPNNKIIAFDPQNRFHEKGKVEKTLVNKKLVDSDWFNLLEEKDCLLIIDDHRMLLPSDTLDPNFLRLLALRDEQGIDIIMITHHPSLIQNRLTYYITHLLLFYTNKDDKNTGIDKKIMNASKVERLMEEINTHVKQHGKGEYPNFPHIVYEYQEDKHVKVNF